MNPVVESLLLRSAILFLLVGSLAGLVVGALLISSPQRLRSAGNILNRWVSTRQLNKSLDRNVVLDSWLYRYRRASAWLILLGSGYILYAFTIDLDRAVAVIELSKRFTLPTDLVGALLDALVLIALLGALLAVFVGLFLLLRPSLLWNFEQGANRWLSLRQALKPLEIQRGGADEFIFKYARRAGIALMVGSLYTLVLLSFWLVRFH
ncbi:MAG: hypothetical protein Q7U91_03775 [Sideroxyarcus sp.]|nr:hypothetical protein [Sideroxyarcus sp.]